MSTAKPIVVGVDGSTYSRQALRWALAEADSHQQPVIVVATWTAPPVPSDPAFASVPWGTSVDRGPETRKMLEGMVAEVSPDFPEVEIEQRAESGNAAQVLISLSQDAAQVVIGAKGHGGFVGMLLGSVSQHVLSHSHCTVTVVR